MCDECYEDMDKGYASTHKLKNLNLIAVFGG